MHVPMNQTATNATLSVCDSPLFCVLYSVSLGLGLPTNLFIIWTITSATSAKISADIFTLNQFVSEIILCLTGLFFFLHSYGDIPRIIFHGLWGLILTTRPLFQTMVCVEQYLAVVQPVRFLQFKPLRYRLACVTAAWLLSSVFCAGYVVMQFSRGFVYMAAAEFLSMLLVMGFCCLSVLKTLTRPVPGARERPPAAATPHNSTKTRAIKVILFILLLNVFFYTPGVLAMLLSGSIPLERLVEINTVSLGCFIFAGFAPALLFFSRSRKLACISI